MSGTEHHEMWHALNAATGEVIEARRAVTPEAEAVRLRLALKELAAAKRLLEKRLEQIRLRG